VRADGTVFGIGGAKIKILERKSAGKLKICPKMLDSAK
jgi:hypothetical protein